MQRSVSDDEEASIWLLVFNIQHCGFIRLAEAALEFSAQRAKGFRAVLLRLKKVSTSFSFASANFFTFQYLFLTFLTLLQTLLAFALQINRFYRNLFQPLVITMRRSSIWRCFKAQISCGRPVTCRGSRTWFKVLVFLKFTRSVFFTIHVVYMF